MSPDTILVIEDDEADFLLLCNCLKKSGLTNPVTWITDGDEALKFLRYQVEIAGQGSELVLPLFVLLDLQLPKLNGFEVLANVRKIPELARLVIIVLTSSSIESDVLLAYELGARSYLVKPPSSADLAAVVKTVTGMPSPTWLESNSLPGIGSKFAKR